LSDVQRGVGPQLFSSSYGSAEISGTVPAANGTALWERYPTRGILFSGEKRGFKHCRNSRLDAVSGQGFGSTSASVASGHPRLVSLEAHGCPI